MSQSEQGRQSVLEGGRRPSTALQAVAGFDFSLWALGSHRRVVSWGSGVAVQLDTD